MKKPLIYFAIIFSALTCSCGGGSARQDAVDSVARADSIANARALELLNQADSRTDSLQDAEHFKIIVGEALEQIYSTKSKALNFVTEQLAKRLKAADIAESFRFTPDYGPDVKSEYESGSLSVSTIDPASGIVNYTIKMKMTDEEGGITTDRARISAKFIVDSTSVKIDSIRINGHDY